MYCWKKIPNLFLINWTPHLANCPRNQKHMFLIFAHTLWNLKFFRNVVKKFFPIIAPKKFTLFCKFLSLCKWRFSDAQKWKCGNWKKFSLGKLDSCMCPNNSLRKFWILLSFVKIVIQKWICAKASLGCSRIPQCLYNEKKGKFKGILEIETTCLD